MISFTQSESMQWLALIILIIGIILYFIISKICDCIESCKESETLNKIAEKAEVYELTKEQADLLNSISNENDMED